MIQSLEGMDLTDRIREMSGRIAKRLNSIKTEEATKTALVLPFVTHVLGFNVFDPDEVVPEYTADVGTKKGEKVDYAIVANGSPIMIFECKHYGVDLTKEPASQLYRYFSVTEARLRRVDRRRDISVLLRHRCTQQDGPPAVPRAEHAGRGIHRR